jgi:O-acetyl-ADP-ribose deacetylase (regulator of RNase III)
LELCVENGLKSVAFSGISTGIYGYPIEDAARVACDEVRKFLESDKGQKVSFGFRFALSLLFTDQLLFPLSLRKIDQVIFCNFRPVDVSSCKPFSHACSARRGGTDSCSC